MPLDASFNNLGTDADDAPVSEYCMFCYKDGGFTNPTQTVDEMVQSSIDFMTGTMDFTSEQASQMSNAVIRTLKRWS